MLDAAPLPLRPTLGFDPRSCRNSDAKAQSVRTQKSRSGSARSFPLRGFPHLSYRVVRIAGAMSWSQENHTKSLTVRKTSFFQCAVSFLKPENCLTTLLEFPERVGERMRIVFLAPDVDLSRSTGEISHVEDLARALARSGCFVTLFVAKASSWVPPPNVRVRTMSSRNTLRSALSIASAIRNDRPHVIYERRVTPKLGAAIGWLVRRPYVVEVNGLVEDERAILRTPRERSVKSGPLRRFIRARLLQRAAGVVTVTEKLGEELKVRFAVSPAKITVLPNGVDLVLFHPISRGLARARLGLDPSALYLVFVGTLVPWQGLETVLVAADLVRRERPGVRLIIVGDGLQRAELERTALSRHLEEVVRFVGSVRRDEVPQWIAAADIGIASKSGGIRAVASPLKLREYLACGVPVVATDLGGLEPSVSDASVGETVPPDNPEAMAAAILRLLANPAARIAMGARARAFAETNLSWDIVAERLVALFAKCNAKGGRW